MTKRITVDGRSASLWSWIITFALPILIMFIPVGETFTGPIRTYIAITLWMILSVAFDLFNPLIPGCLVCVLYYVCGVAPLEVAFGLRKWPTPWWAVSCWPRFWTNAG